VEAKVREKLAANKHRFHMEKFNLKKLDEVRYRVKTKLMSLHRTVRTRTLQTCIEEQINLRRATNLELT
jgi:hypothetical protein